MRSIIKTEFLKMKRYHILLIGLLVMVCSPLLQFYSQLVVNEEFKCANFDIPALVENTIWGNAQIFMPVLFTLIGGYLVNREYTDDTLKNILTVPVSFRKFLAGKLAVMGLLAVLFGIYSFAVTLAVGLFGGLSNLNLSVFIKGLPQMIGLSVCIYIVVLPIITVCSRKPGHFMVGSVIAFLTGYCVLFFKEGLLRNIYPYSVALTMIGFDTASYSGTSGKGSVPLGAASLGIMLLITAVLIVTSKAPGDVHGHGKKGSGKKGITLRAAQREKSKAGR